jgi:hypothetical protein
MEHCIPTRLDPITATHPTKVKRTRPTLHMITAIILLNAYLALGTLFGRLCNHRLAGLLVLDSLGPEHPVLVVGARLARVPRRLVHGALAEVAKDACEER